MVKTLQHPIFLGTATVLLLGAALMGGVVKSGERRTTNYQSPQPSHQHIAARPLAATAFPAPPVPQKIVRLPLYTQWRTFTVKEGLPSNKVFCVRFDGKRVWFGTDNGLASYEDGRWRTYGLKDGLPSLQVLSLDVSPRTGDLWIGTMDGLARYSGGRFEVFNQLNSGLANNFVHNVACDPDDDIIWAATAMGASRFDLRKREWRIFTDENAPLGEPWTYSISVGQGMVYVGAWGGGVAEYNERTGLWQQYMDPDGQFEVDLLPNDGPVHNITAGVSYVDGILWQGTYFGASRYDGHRWRGYFTKNSGLASEFIQFVRARGRVAWMCTDSGLSATDGDNWATYRRLEDGRGEIRLYHGAKRLERRITPTAIAHRFVLGVDFQGESIWVTTEGGVSHGLLGDYWTYR